MKPISVKESLPKDRTYVLAHVVIPNPWIDDDHPSGCYWKVVKFVRGISKAERDALHDCERKRIYKSEDEHENNQRPYCWEEFGPGKFFGQEVDCWLPLPEDSECG